MADAPTAQGGGSRTVETLLILAALALAAYFLIPMINARRTSVRAAGPDEPRGRRPDRGDRRQQTAGQAGAPPAAPGPAPPAPRPAVEYSSAPAMQAIAQNLAIPMAGVKPAAPVRPTTIAVQGFSSGAGADSVNSLLLGGTRKPAAPPNTTYYAGAPAQPYGTTAATSSRGVGTASAALKAPSVAIAPPAPVPKSSPPPALVQSYSTKPAASVLFKGPAIGSKLGGGTKPIGGGLAFAR